MPATVWVLHIENDDGNIVSLHTTEAGATARALAYVRMYWLDSMVDEDGNPVPMPADAEEAIEMYFFNDKSGTEDWIIEEQEVNTDEPSGPEE